MTACANPYSSPEMLASLCGHDGDGMVDVDNVNLCRRPRTCFWVLIFWFFEMAVWLRIMTSVFALRLAYLRGSTALHAAAQNGRTTLVRWLLDHGAHPSLHVKNAMGCTPLDVARVFGPHPETVAVLIQATIREDFDARCTILPDGTLFRKTREQRPNGLILRQSR